jgi:type IX secretion system PorP/SprF family membrane protein
MKIRIILSIVSISVCINLPAQLLSVYSQIYQNQTTYNPGATGNMEVFVADFSYRQQWVKFDVAPPSTQVLCAHAPLKNPKVAMGILVDHDASGGSGYTGIFLNYAYRVNLGMNKLSLGLKGGITNGSQNNVELEQNPDPTFSDNNKTYYVPNFGVGALYYGKKYWAGVSVPLLFIYETKKSDGYKISQDFSQIQYILSGGASLSVNPELKIDPAALLIYCPSLPSSFTANVSASYRNTYIAGLGYRNGTSTALIFLLGFNVNRQFSLGYSYDFNMGDLKKQTLGSHEINILYKFGYQVNAANPRQF